MISINESVDKYCDISKDTVLNNILTIPTAAQLWVNVSHQISQTVTLYHHFNLTIYYKNTD